MPVEMTRRFPTLDLDVYIKEMTAKAALEEYNKIVGGLFPSSDATYCCVGEGLYKLVKVED
jgi:hypothetical protein